LLFTFAGGMLPLGVTYLCDAGLGGNTLTKPVEVPARDVAAATTGRWVGGPPVTGQDVRKGKNEVAQQCSQRRWQNQHGCLSWRFRGKCVGKLQCYASCQRFITLFCRLAELLASLVPAFLNVPALVLFPDQ
jgi:arylamine N-acetyltransferase